ncbi:MAG: hypothetical protein JNL79_28565 [Myxococcales bacterium]|nr:hypothetical protein [Myxococcales bacterium]
MKLLAFGFALALSLPALAHAETGTLDTAWYYDTIPPDTAVSTPDTSSSTDTGGHDTSMGATDSAVPGRCSADGTGFISGDMVYSCAPYRCLAAVCQEHCKVNTDCTDGFVCQANKCVEPADKTSGDAAQDPTVKYGCTVGGHSSGFVAIAFILGALSLARRKN